MNDLQNAVTEKFAQIAASGAIEAMIEKQLTETIGSIIQRQLETYSDFGKAVGEAVKKAVNVDIDRLELPGYNDLILKLIQRNVMAQMETSIESQVAKQMAELLAPPPAEIKLSDLIKQFIEMKSSDDNQSDNPENITLIIQAESYGFSHIYFDEEPDKEKYRCGYSIHLDKEGKAYSIKIDGEDTKKKLFVGPFYNFEKLMFNIHAAGVKVVLDQGDSEDDYETEYPHSSY